MNLTENLTENLAMTHVVQFTSMSDFIADLEAGDVAGVYHELIDQRVAADGRYGTAEWRLAVIIRALVANGRLTHVASLTTPVSQSATFIAGEIAFVAGHVVSDKDEANRERWSAGQARYGEMVVWLEHECARLGLANLVRPGLVHVPADLSTIYAPYEFAVDLVPAGEGEHTPEVVKATEGWGCPLNSRKWHYFRSGKSLCNKWMFSSDGLSDEDIDSPDNCAVCTRKRKFEIFDLSKVGGDGSTE
jgi:hypothetical protein